MLFVCGVHGVGKTEYCRELAAKKGIPTFSASDLINKMVEDSCNGKRVNDISENQDILIKQVRKLKEEIDDFILDGHMCLINQSGNIEFIQEKVFRLLGIQCIEVLVENSNIICTRLMKRDNEAWNETMIENFQNAEITYAKKIAKLLGIDIRIIKVSEKGQGRKCCFGKNIILPIKPRYVEKILDKEKKYEYRKQICIDNIDKIYLYATAPVKAILGEADVLEKIIMNKENLWKLTKEQSGISKDYFDDYFGKSEMASAYRLGEIEKYQKPILLSEVGIKYVPQSYIYVPNLRCVENKDLEI